MHVRCVIFDFGNVISFFDLPAAYERLAARSSAPMDGPTAGDAIQDLREIYERGEMSTAAFLAGVRERLSLAATPAEIAEVWCQIFTANRSVLDVIPQLRRASCRLVLASNTNELHYEHFRRQFAEALDLFDAEVLSYRLKIKKPDARFYASCVKAAGCDASECVYVDDIRSFVEAAEKLGIAGLVYEPALDLTKALQSLGVVVGLGR